MNTLPKIATPTFRLTIPSTSKEVIYRPYLVKEEKILMMAIETGDEGQMTDAIAEIIKSCFNGIDDVNKLTPYDIEYLFVNLRSKSVGEGITMNMECDECGNVSEQAIDLNKIVIKNVENSTTVEIAEGISIEMRYPKMHEHFEVNTTELLIEGVTSLIDTIYHGSESYPTKDVSRKDLDEFVEGLTADQFSKLVEIVAEMPYISYDMKYKCGKCGHINEIEFKGLADFFI
jgi:hypothetical protein